MPSRIVCLLKPAPGVHGQSFGLYSPFVHDVTTTISRSVSGLLARRCTAAEVGSSSAPEALARDRVVLSRSVIT